MVLKSDTLLPLTAPANQLPLRRRQFSRTAIWHSCLLDIAVTCIPARITKPGDGGLPTNHFQSVQTPLQNGSYDHRRRFALQICRRRSEISGRSKLKGEHSSDGCSCGVLNDGPPAEELAEFFWAQNVGLQQCSCETCFQMTKKHSWECTFQDLVHSIFTAADTFNLH